MITTQKPTGLCPACVDNSAEDPTRPEVTVTKNGVTSKVCRPCRDFLVAYGWREGDDYR